MCSAIPTVSSQPPANCLRELSKKDLLSLYKMQSSCWTFLSCICPNTFWTSANLWHQVWLVAVSLTLCVLPGVFFLFCKLIISFHAALLLHGVRQWTSLLTCSRLKRYQLQICQVLAQLFNHHPISKKEGNPQTSFVFAKVAVTRAQFSMWSLWGGRHGVWILL